MLFVSSTKYFFLFKKKKKEFSQKKKTTILLQTKSKDVFSFWKKLGDTDATKMELT